MMNDAPDRINLTGTVANGLYVRADLFDALQAENDRLRGAVNQLIQSLNGLQDLVNDGGVLMLDGQPPLKG